jgi:hypothetical protein
MASGKSNYLSQKVLDAEFGIAAFTFPSTIHLALFTVAPSAAGGGTEVSGSGYARVAVTANATNWSRSAQTVSNVNQILFNAFTGAVSTVVAVAAFDASTGGNMLWFADLPAPNQKSFSANDQAVYPASSITVTEA